jgi:acetolactate synthase-1/3 small subunit
MTIGVEGDEKTLEQIKKQLNKLVDVIKVVDFKEGDFIDRELVLVKVAVTAKNRKEVLDAIESFVPRLCSARILSGTEGSGAKIENAGSKSISVEATGDQMRVRALLELLRPFGILEVVRTGRIAMSMEDKGLKVEGKPEVNE